MTIVFKCWVAALLLYNTCEKTPSLLIELGAFQCRQSPGHHPFGIKMLVAVTQFSGLSRPFEA